MTWQLILISAGIAFAQESSFTTLRDIRVGATRDVILLGKRDGKSAAEACLNLLGAPDIRMGRVLMYPSETAARMRFRAGQTSCRPKSLIQFSRENGLPVNPLRCPELAEGIKIGTSILLRRVDADCVVTSAILKGDANPLVIQSMGKEHEILALSTDVAAASRRAWGKEYAAVDLFVRTPEPTEALAKDILAWAKNISGARDVTTVLSTDFGLGTHCSFPQPFLFAGPPASKAGFQTGASAGRLICVALFPYDAQCWSEAGAR